MSSAIEELLLFDCLNFRISNNFRTIFVCFRIAVNNHHYISRDLGIKNPVHKHKLSLKAMDVVLFGPPKSKIDHCHFQVLGH